MHIFQKPQKALKAADEMCVSDFPWMEYLYGHGKILHLWTYKEVFEYTKLLTACFHSNRLVYCWALIISHKLNLVHTFHATIKSTSLYSVYFEPAGKKKF